MKSVWQTGVTRKRGISIGDIRKEPARNGQRSLANVVTQRRDQWRGK